MVKDLLYRLVEHPKRKWIVTILTILVLLVVTWPVVDLYNAAAVRCQELATALETTRSLVANLDQFEQTVNTRLTSLKELEEQSMSDTEVEKFRSRVVQLVRDSGCRMRRIRVGEPRSRQWFNEDNVLSVRPVSTKAKTPFELLTRTFSVSVTGSMGNISSLLAKLAEEEKLIHSSRFSLQSSEDSQEGAVLDLDLLLMELRKADESAT